MFTEWMIMNVLRCGYTQWTSYNNGLISAPLTIFSYINFNRIHLLMVFVLTWWTTIKCTCLAVSHQATEGNKMNKVDCVHTDILVGVNLKSTTDVLAPSGQKYCNVFFSFSSDQLRAFFLSFISLSFRTVFYIILIDSSDLSTSPVLFNVRTILTKINLLDVWTK